MENLQELFVVDEARLKLRTRLLEESRRLIQRGGSWNDVIVFLQDQGLSIVESVWVIREISLKPLSEVKDIVTTHPIWAEMVRATEPLHDALEKALIEEKSADGES